MVNPLFPIYTNNDATSYFGHYSISGGTINAVNPVNGDLLYGSQYCPSHRPQDRS